MKNKKFFLAVASLIVIILSVVVVWYALSNKEHESLIISTYFGVLGIIISVLWSNYLKQTEIENINNRRKHYKSGYVAITFLILSLVYMLIVFLFQWDDRIWVLTGGVTILVSAIWTIILGILSKQSLSGQEDCIVEPEKFWRIIWNMLPARFGYEKNPILNVLIIHSAEGADLAKQMRQRYEQTKNELWIDLHSCVGNNREQLENRLTTRNYIGIHLIYTEDIKSEMPWVRELCYEWSQNNKSKPIVYTNCTSEHQPLNYGTSSKDSDSILRLFQRTYSLSELWREQANIHHKFFKWLTIFFIIILSGLIYMFFNTLKSNEQLILVGGGTVKEYLEKNINTKIFPMDNLIFVPTPTGIGCEKLGDEGFTRQLQGRVIIMSSEYQEREDSLVIKNFRLDRNTTVTHILEVFLCRDTFYIKSKGINNFDTFIKKDTGGSTLGITKSALIEKIEKDNNIKRVFHTNERSGTYKFYENVIKVAKNKGFTDSESVYYADEKDEKFNRHNNYIILTRTFYDPIPKPQTSISKINILDSLGKKPELGNLFLYIPITDKEIKNNRYVLPNHIQKFLESIESKVCFPKEIDGINGYDIMISDTSYNKYLK